MVRIGYAVDEVALYTPLSTALTVVWRASEDEFPHSRGAAPYLFGPHDEAFDATTDLILDAIEREAGDG